MKRLIITEEEKQRILQMHESAIKKNYLSEQNAQPAQTSKILPGAETDTTYAITKGRFTNDTGADFGTIINLYRTGKPQGSIPGKDRTYYFTIEVASKKTNFYIKELQVDGSLETIMMTTYNADFQKDKWTVDTGYSKSSAQQEGTSNWNGITSDSKLSGNKWTFFWNNLVRTTNGLDAAEITRFLQSNKTKNIPYTLKDAIANKANLRKEENSEITDQTIATIKSSVAYKAI